MNWKVRLKSKKWWLAMIPAILFVANTVSRWFGVEIPTEIIESEAARIIEGLGVVLILMGINIDPTTPGLSDSDVAMTY